MGDGNRRGPTRPHDDDQFPIRLRMWLEENEGIVAGLVRLRELPRAESAVEAVLAVPEIKRLRLSFELWIALVSGDGDEPDRLLLGQVSLESLRRSRIAIWGLEGDCSTEHLWVVDD